MRTGLAVAAVVLTMLAGGCSRQVRARSYWATTTYRMPCCSTYTWSKEKRVAVDAGVDPELVAFLEERIEAELAALCYEKRAGAETSDFVVSYHAGAAIQPTSAGPTNMATLAVEAHTPDGRLIWRGWAEAALDVYATPEMRRERIEHTIRAIVHEFHPECFREGDPPACHCG